MSKTILCMLQRPSMTCKPHDIDDLGVFVCSDSVWDPAPQVRGRVASMLDETHRVLMPRGKFISITFSQPFMRRIFTLGDSGEGRPDYTWSMRHVACGEPGAIQYFVYVHEKGTRSAADLAVPASTALIDVQPMHEHMDSEEYLFQIQI